ncbi:MAG: hypothetical protein HC897_11385 [Thermoanaerobaculia bacterium]|nr:hypothetical protein [Thermoanaerobaculia bacterium]
MSAAQLHLLVVHLPVVGCLAALVLLAIGEWRRSELVFQIACGFLLGCAAAAAVAYYSGPAAYEQLATVLEAEKTFIEDHAVLGRAAFVGMVIVGVVALQALLQYLQDEKPAPWLRWLLLVLTLAMCGLFAWAAHLGGLIRHVEVR